MSHPTPMSPGANGPPAAPPPLPARARRPGRFWWVGFLFARLRFVVILAALGFVLVKWETLLAHYEKWARPAAAASAADPNHEYFCPMHPTVVRDTNKEKCPICFMPLSKRKKGEATDDPLPAGTVSRVQLTPYRVVLAGVRTAAVGHTPLVKEITTVGTVEFNERKLWTVSARVKGRIDKLYVNQTGQMVHRNDPLADLYSPDLVVTVQNLLDARQMKNPSLEAGARDRLRLWGIDDAQLDEIVRAGKPITHLTVRSRIDGHVLRKAVREGQYVEEGTAMFEVADLSTVWVQAQLYEDDLGFLPPGGHDPETGAPDFDLPVTATTRAFPNRAFAGRLSFLYPHVDTATRTLTVRFELPNPDHELRPGMTATVSLALTPELLNKTPAGAGVQARGGGILAVPESAVIDTGSQKVVYRESLPNTFEGVLVRLGPRMRDPAGAFYYPVLSGVAEGDRVAVAGSFLLDAETRLNPAMGSVYIGGSGGGSGGGVTVRPTTPDDEEAAVTAAMAKLPPDDRTAAGAQKWCPVLGGRLGSMGVPVKVALGGGRSVFVCCKGCVKEAAADPAKSLRRVEELKTKGTGAPLDPPPPTTTSPEAPKVSPEEIAEIRAELQKLPPGDRVAAEVQRLCPVQGEWIGSMPNPKKLMIRGQAVFICCKGCENAATADPDQTLKKVAESRKLPPLGAGVKP